MGGRGFEPLTSSVSRKRSPPELTARARHATRSERRGPESNRCARLCRPLPNHSATPPYESPGSPGRATVYSAAMTCTKAPIAVLCSDDGQAVDLSRVRLGRDPREDSRDRHLRRRHGVCVRRLRLGLRPKDRPAACGPLEELHPSTADRRPKQRRRRLLTARSRSMKCHLSTEEEPWKPTARRSSRPWR